MIRYYWHIFLMLSRQDQVLFILTFSILLLLIFVLFLAGSTFYLRTKNARKSKKYFHLERIWNPVLLDIISEDRDPSAIRFYVKNKDIWQFLTTLSRYISRVDGEAKQRLIEAGKPYIKVVIRKLDSWKVEKRAEVISLMQRLDPERYDPAFRKALNDRSFLVNMVAARALARKDHQENGEAILRHLDRFKIWSVNLLSALIAQVGTVLSPSLRELMINKEKPAWQRVVAVETLHKLYDFKAGDYIAEICTPDEDREVVAAYLRLLRVIGDEKHIPCIRDMCKRNDPVIVANSIRVLTQLEHGKEFECLKKAMDHPSIWVVINATWGLKESGKLDVLRQYAYSDHPRSELARQVLTEV
jgi:hypothetical protein